MAAQKISRFALTAMVVGGMVGAGVFSIPRNFDYDRAESIIEYGFVTIDGKKYLLPVESENLACFTGTAHCVRNVILFENYRKFGSQSSITFDK